MKFETPLIPATFVARYKRFFADVLLEDGNQITVHCANPGSMKSCQQPGGRVWISDSQNPARRLRHTWEIAQVGRAKIFVNPVRANRVVEHALRAKKITELCDHDEMKREVRYGKHSRIDFLLSRGDARCYVEVKNMTLGLGQGRAAFPDAVTLRGTRHLHELERMVRDGQRAVLFFCVSRSDALTAEPADDIDPVYGKALRRAASKGVEVLAYRCAISPQRIAIAKRIPVLL